MENDLSFQNDELREELERTRRDLSILYEVSNAMRTTLELNHILYIILTGVTSHTGLGFNRAILFLQNNIERCLEPKIAIGPESGEHAKIIWSYIAESKKHLDDLIKQENINPNAFESALFRSIKDIRIPLDHSNNSLLATAYHQGTAMHIDSENIQQYANDTFLQRFHTSELIIMPLRAKDKVNGLIIADNLYTKKTISEEDLKIFMMLANQAGLAIENSRLYEVVMQKSNTDSITGLWNHGYFQSQLSKELEKSISQNYPTSLVLIDIDNFKRFNDNYGHQNGDVVLKEIAHILKDSAREIDFPCRYGGEEFSIILPQINRDQAFAIAERIRMRIENHALPKFVENQDIRVTVSIGISSFPDDTKNKEELIKKSDKAMYIAKFSGKNRTCIYRDF